MLWGSSNKRDLAVWPQTEQLKVYVVHNVRLLSATLHWNNAGLTGCGFFTSPQILPSRRIEKKKKKEITEKGKEKTEILHKNFLGSVNHSFGWWKASCHAEICISYVPLKEDFISKPICCTLWTNTSDFPNLKSLHIGHMTGPDYQGLIWCVEQGQICRSYKETLFLSL